MVTRKTIVKKTYVVCIWFGNLHKLDIYGMVTLWWTLSWIVKVVYNASFLLYQSLLMTSLTIITSIFFILTFSSKQQWANSPLEGPVFQLFIYLFTYRTRFWIGVFIFRFRSQIFWKMLCIPKLCIRVTRVILGSIGTIRFHWRSLGNSYCSSPCSIFPQSANRISFSTVKMAILLTSITTSVYCAYILNQKTSK